MNKKIIISRYNENIEWVKSYDFDYIVYNKGEELDNSFKSINVPNIGNNQRDIFNFIVDNYDNLPDIMVFIQANPFDHCNKDAFDRLINNTVFTPLETFGHIEQNQAQKLDSDGGYMEMNNSWYISAHNSTHNQTCSFESFEDFMNKTFTNYVRSDWNRFTPGSQYLVTKEIVKHYPKDFWEYLMNILHKNNMTEGHIIERALLMIFKCDLIIKNNLK